ncbi:hypothetical protein ACFW91_24995 [Streptomyces asoensis]|uniref:hypothetical protein n=1 Tax=Streptomyces asoensis TaxID=249586 RepID=UPI00369FC275
MEPGDLATWFGTSFAAIAAGATLWTLKSQRDQIGEQRRFIGEQSATLALERAELRAAAEERRTSQARQVTMKTDEATTGSEGRLYWLVDVVNHSDTAIRDVQVRFGTAHTAASAHSVRMQGDLPLQTQLGLPREQPVHTLGPGQVVQFRSPHWTPPTCDSNPPSLSFTDADGVRWTRSYHGALVEGPGPEA